MNQSAQYNKPWKSFDELPMERRTALVKECLKQGKPHGTITQPLSEKFDRDFFILNRIF